MCVLIAEKNLLEHRQLSGPGLEKLGPDHFGRKLNGNSFCFRKKGSSLLALQTRRYIRDHQEYWWLSRWIYSNWSYSTSYTCWSHFESNRIGKKMIWVPDWSVKRTTLAIILSLLVERYIKLCKERNNNLRRELPSGSKPICTSRSGHPTFHEISHKSEDICGILRRSLGPYITGLRNNGTHMLNQWKQKAQGNSSYTFQGWPSLIFVTR